MSTRYIVLSDHGRGGNYGTYETRKAAQRRAAEARRDGDRGVTIQRLAPTGSRGPWFLGRTRLGTGKGRTHPGRRRARRKGKSRVQKLLGL